MNKSVRTQESLLVVDDVPEVLDGIEELLLTDGYAVDTARSEDRAVESAQRRPPQIILLNLEGQPEVVIATARRIRDRAKLDAVVPIVLFCADWIAEGEEVHLGNNVYAIQPDNFNGLRDFLARLLKF
ncbi:MAG TPA: hypothetical protein PLZ79_00575 [Burkholderiales bacterium]|nr:hypothetical protein [Betaproteobacteria bacterium]HQR51734.1 hypothetical protein [Burkholderiales bacterium]